MDSPICRLINPARWKIERRGHGVGADNDALPRFREELMQSSLDGPDTPPPPPPTPGGGGDCHLGLSEPCSNLSA
jgi:hypothetical protein